MGELYTQVLVVGAGPVGLALAGDLAWRGQSSIVVEKSNGAITQPKMDLIGPRTMEFCRRWGIADQVIACPNNPDHPQDTVWLESFGGFEFGREPFPSPRTEALPPQSPMKRERCPQDMFDPIMRRWVESMPLASLRYNTELIDFEESGHGVRARVRGPDGEQTICCDYLVGADGGASFVRHKLGIEMDGKPILTHTTNAIFRCPDFWRLHNKPKGYRCILIGPEGTWGTIVAIDGHDRFRFSAVGDENRKVLSYDEVHALIVRAMGKNFPFELLSISPWVRRELVARSYGASRVFITGDAAHLNSPTGAFGMNTGMQDAVDLGWKLAGMLQGWGGARLMDSYEAERRPVALRNVAEASENLRRMISTRKHLSPDVFVKGHEGDEARRVFGEAYTQMMKREWFTLHIHLGYRYDQSTIIVDDGTHAPDDPPCVYTQNATPGSRAPHVWLKPGVSTLDLFGKGFVLLRFERDARVAHFADEALNRCAPLAVIDIDHAEARALYAAPLVLVRPDGMVAWRGEGGDAKAIWSQVCGD